MAFPFPQHWDARDGVFEDIFGALSQSLQPCFFAQPIWDPRLEPRPLPDGHIVKLEQITFEPRHLAKSSTFAPIQSRPLSHTSNRNNLSTCIIQALYRAGQDGDAESTFVDRENHSSPPAAMLLSQTSARLKQADTPHQENLLLSPNRKYSKRNGGNPGESVSRFSHHQDFLWLDQFQKLLRFKESFGHCNVPIAYPDDQALARWVKRQRYQYKRMKKGKPSSISITRIQMLESAGFVWDAHSVAWQEKFNAVAAYKKQTGHCKMPSSSYAANQENSDQLASWMKRQRRQYRLLVSGQPSNITMERINALNSIGFVWQTTTASDTTL